MKLMDFGIARSGESAADHDRTTLGSISYMSPEQVKGEPWMRAPTCTRSVSLYEFVTGRRPFLANSEYSIMAAHLNQVPKPPLELNPGLPAALNEIILMAIAKDPAKRFQAAEAFANALTTVPASSAVAPTVPRTPLGGPTGGSPSGLPAFGKLRRLWKGRARRARGFICAADGNPAGSGSATAYNSDGIRSTHDAGDSSDAGYDSGPPLRLCAAGDTGVVPRHLRQSRCRLRRPAVIAACT